MNVDALGWVPVMPQGEKGEDKCPKPKKVKGSLASQLWIEALSYGCYYPARSAGVTVRNASAEQ